MQWKEPCRERKRRRNGADDNDEELSEDEKEALPRDFDALRRVEPRLKPARKEQHGGVRNDEGHGIPQRSEQGGDSNPTKPIRWQRWKTRTGFTHGRQDREHDE